MIRIKPEAFVKECFKLSPLFVPYTQQDSQEFMIILLEKLENDIKEAFPAMSSVISDIFQGESMNFIKCEACNNENIVYEPFIQLALPILDMPNIPELDSFMSDQEKDFIIEHRKGPLNIISSLIREKNTLNLYYCLKSYFSEQIAEHYCYKCQDVTNQKIKIGIKKYPKSLILSLKRFRYSRWNSKISDKVFLPYYINFSNIFPGQNFKYEITGVIEHIDYFFKGHYKAYIKKQTDWYVLDDKNVKKCNWEDVFKAQAYIFIYTRVDQIFEVSKKQKTREEKKEENQEGKPEKKLEEKIREKIEENLEENVEERDA